MYLDQNVLSTLAKARLGRPLPDGLRDAADDLLTALQESVHTVETARCVESVFHRWESHGLLSGARDDAAELHAAISELVGRYAWGLRFATFEQVVSNQAAAATWADASAAEDLWRVAFNLDPDEANSKASVNFGGVDILVRAEWRPPLFPLPNDWADKAEQARRSTERSDFVSYRKQLVSARQSDPSTRRRILSALLSAGCSLEDIQLWLDGQDFEELPAVQVASALHAHVLNDARRRVKNSDWCDGQILALAVPYCDLVLADNYMADAVRSRRLDSKYETTVLGSSASDYRQAAAWLRESRPGTGAT